MLSVQIFNGIKVLSIAAIITYVLITFFQKNKSLNKNECLYNQQNNTSFKNDAGICKNKSLKPNDRPLSLIKWIE